MSREEIKKMQREIGTIATMQVARKISMAVVRMVAEVAMEDDRIGHGVKI